MFPLSAVEAAEPQGVLETSFTHIAVCLYDPPPLRPPLRAPGRGEQILCSGAHGLAGGLAGLPRTTICPSVVSRYHRDPLFLM
ncbi:unnamed protein product [Boreogadus saida]